MSGPDPTLRFEGKQVLVAEDEFHVLLLLEDMLASLGCQIVETASRVDVALQLARNCNVDVAVLDINLAGQKIYPAAETLKQRGIPLVFSTGYSLAGIDPAWSMYPVVQKPFLLDRLAHALARALPSQQP